MAHKSPQNTARPDNGSTPAKPVAGRVLFIEGDLTHSIDIRLYSAVFPEYSVRPLGSCDRVIECTRTLAGFRDRHNIDIHGIVDRDRRSESEVGYLRSKQVMVPNVAEIENIFLVEEVVAAMAAIRGKNPKRVVKAVRHEVIEKFVARIDAQALEHTRYRMKRDVERKIDARFTCITALELHIKSLIHKLRPRETYDRLRSDFTRMANSGSYSEILKVFNHKRALTESCVARMLGYSNADSYVEGVISTIRRSGADSENLRKTIRGLFA